ncbi:hypothetical protein EB118_21655 [bacterium]|nr:hypothetical protein [bacterium]NDD83055.1 hypothetical protein [bacterium]NDG32666.1 hypothetical protein [bacterium]
MITTDTQLLRKQVKTMLKDIDNGYTLEELKNKYNYLYTSSKTLFTYIASNRNANLDNLDMMLDKIEKIKKSQVSQHDASVEVGTSLAKQFIPQIKDN